MRGKRIMIDNLFQKSNTNQRRNSYYFAASDEMYEEAENQDLYHQQQPN